MNMPILLLLAVYIFAHIIHDVFILWINGDYKLIKNHSQWCLYLLLTCGIYAVTDFIDDYFKLSFSLKRFVGIIEFVILIGIGFYEIVKTKDKEEKNGGIIFLIMMMLIVIVSDVFLKWIELI